MRRSLRAAVAVLVAAGLASTVHAGGVDWSGSIGLSVGDGAYLNLSLNHFERDGTESLPVARRLTHPEAELPVLLFLAHESGRSANFILDLRLQGLSWWDVRARVGVAPERVIVALPRDPGPPHGKAHGHHKHGKHRRSKSLVISDAEFSDWVGVRILSSAYGVEPLVVFEARRAGVSLAEFTVAEDKARYGRREHHSSQRDDKGRGRGRGRGRSGHRHKGHGH